MMELNAQELALLSDVLGTANSSNPQIKVRLGMLHMKVVAALERAAQEAAAKRDGAGPPPGKAAMRRIAKEVKENE